MTNRGNRRSKPLLLAACALAIVPAAASAQQAPAPITYDIPAQDLGTALTELARQSNREIYFSTDLTRGKRAPRLRGSIPVERALERLLDGSGLTYKLSPSGAITIESAVGNGSAAGETASSSGEGASAGAEKGLAEILVVGKRSLNVDIPRTENDPQPYVVFNRQDLEKSGAVDLNDFFRKKVSMNAQGTSAAQGQPGQLGYGAASEINLRGLGSSQTLILVDGRRMPSAYLGGIPSQPSINGIPFSAIDRIEILPTTASGIYGGGATGGVVNIILRHDYSGGEIIGSLSTAGEHEPQAGKLEFTKGFNFGRTSILVTGSYSKSGELLYSDRSFLQRARERIVEDNFPAGLLAFGVLPPLGGTSNIRSSDGSPLFGPGTSSFTFVPSGYAGGGGAAPLLPNAGQFNLDVANSAQSNGGGRRNLLTAVTDMSLLSTVRRDFSSSLSGFVEVSASRQKTNFNANQVVAGATVAASAPNNPFGKNIRVSAPLPNLDTDLSTQTDIARVASGLIYKIGRGWSAEADFIWGFYELRYSPFPSFLSRKFAADVRNGTVDLLRDTNVIPIDFSAYVAPPSTVDPSRSNSGDLAFRVGGPLFNIPGGSVKVSTLLEHRYDIFAQSKLTNWDELQSKNVRTIFPSRSQKADSAYAELTAPIVGEPNATSFARKLELQLAVRYDRYKVNGVTTSIIEGSTSTVERFSNIRESLDPTVALLYSPIKSITLRGSYGTGFLPPTVNQLVPTITAAPITVSDPKRGGALTTIPAGAIVSGGNPNLKPELSKSWSWGMILTPDFAPGLRASVDASYIHKTDNIVSSPFTSQQLVDNEALVPDRIIRGTPGPGEQVGPVVGLDLTLFNLATTYVEAYDFAIDYLLEARRIGSFDLHGRLTWQPHYRTQISPIAPVVENVGTTVLNPQKVKLSAGITWESGGWLVDWSAQYFSSYQASLDPVVILSQGNNGKVPSQIYHNLFVRYRFPSSQQSAFLKGLELDFGVNNILNKMPPVDLGATEILYSTLGDPRLRYFTLSVKKSF